MNSIYTFDGIEFTKEQYKILKQFYKSDTLDITDLKSHASEHTVSVAVRFLLDNNFIVRYFDYDLQEFVPDKCCITEYGTQAYELICQHKYNFIVHSITVPIFVSVITSIITTAIIFGLKSLLPLILKWVSSTP